MRIERLEALRVLRDGLVEHLVLHFCSMPNTLARCHRRTQKLGLCDTLATADDHHMTARQGIPVRQRRVAAELRQLRKNAGMTCAETAKAMGVSVTKISQMETGDRGLYVDEVAALLGLYRVPAKLRQELLDLVRNGGDPNWWQMKPSDLPDGWRDLMQLEKDASAIANIEPILIPGLLQTSEYAAATIRGIYGDPPDHEVNAMVATRLARQSLLSQRNAPSPHAIVDEMALQRPIGDPGVMERQLQHLLTCAQRPNVKMQVAAPTVSRWPGRRAVSAPPPATASRWRSHSRRPWPCATPRTPPVPSPTAPGTPSAQPSATIGLVSDPRPSTSTVTTLPG